MQPDEYVLLGAALALQIAEMAFVTMNWKQRQRFIP